MRWTAWKICTQAHESEGHSLMLGSKGWKRGRKSLNDFLRETMCPWVHVFLIKICDGQGSITSTSYSIKRSIKRISVDNKIITLTFQGFVFKKPRPSCQVLCVSFLLQLQQTLSLSFASALSLAPNRRCRVLLVLGPVIPCADTSEKEWFPCYKWLCHFLSRWKYRELQMIIKIIRS